MKRRIYDRLKAWKQKSGGSSAILIDGARRVGKSYIAREFAKNEYKSFIFIDFYNVDSKVRALFDEYLNDLDTFFMYLQSYMGVKLYKRESVIVFDEIQMFPKARGAVKYLVEDGRYDYIETGSLISIKKNVQDIIIPSEEDHIKMYPMDFEEFLWANGNEVLADFIKVKFEKKQPMEPLIHKKALDLFRQYMIVGGMPQAVQEFVNSKDLDKVDTIKRRILNLYREDIQKYATDYASKVTSIFDEVPDQLQRHERKFKLSALKNNARFREYEDSFFWLQDSMVINICYNSTEPSVGLKLNLDRMTLKCYMGDTGLLISQTFDEEVLEKEQIYKKLLFDKLELNKGMLVENIVAQMLRSAGHNLYFYSNPSTDKVEDRMEIDFLVSKKSVTSRHNISPIEVKSSTNYTLTSLRKFITKYKNQLSTPYVIHTNDLKEEEGIVYIPIYMTWLL